MVYRPTNIQNNSPAKFLRSIGGGLKALGNSQRTYFVLEYKQNTEKHKAGETQEIIVDYIEMGRSASCVVNFGEPNTTVSRKHAAIIRENNSWKIKNLSTTNPTLINGKPVKNQWYLSNGDEIQLSYEGPRVGFLTPANNKMSTIGLTRKLSLFKQQALKPYKQGLTALSIAFVAIVFLLSFFLWKGHNDYTELAKNATEVKNTLLDSLQKLNDNNLKFQQKLQREMALLGEKAANSGSRTSTSSRNSTNSATKPNSALAVVFPNVYYIQCTNLKVSFQGESTNTTENLWSGTGFLLNNGKFITARHVIEPWFFDQTDEFLLYLNVFANNGGTIIANFTAYSPNGSTLNFTNNDFKFDKSSDASMQSVDNSGNNYILSFATINDGSDWASYDSGLSGGVLYDSELSQNLQIKDKLEILGYPHGVGATDLAAVSPLYGDCTVSVNGLQNNMIVISDRNFDHGNSGGPVFFNDNNKYYVIGIVSAGIGGTLGYIVPISAVE